MTAPTSPDAIRDVNTRYHDGAAAQYDSKWGIDWGEVGAHQVLLKTRKALGGARARGPFPRALEIGAGTGYFSLHLLMAGVVGEVTCTDISPGMLATLTANADALGLEVQTVACDAGELPFDPGSFELVLGHAVLHHLPDLARAFAEFERVLTPGGTLFFAGEPSRTGDRIASVPKRAATFAAPAWRRALRVRKAAEGHTDGGSENHRLEGSVDVHAFVPEELERLARQAGLQHVRVRGEELLANWFGWANRALEATAEPQDVPWLWRQYAFRGYLALQRVDTRLLERRLPPAIFYNLMISARKAG